MEFLWATLMFLTGWFVCWIQMSKSESRLVQQIRFENYRERKRLASEVERLELDCQVLLRSNQEYGKKIRKLLSQMEELQSENQKLKERLQSQKPLEFESQQWKSKYPD